MKIHLPRSFKYMVGTVEKKLPRGDHDLPPPLARKAIQYGGAREIKTNAKSGAPSNKARLAE